MTGPQLKDLRESRDLTQSQLAAYLGDCSGATISRWEGTTNDVPQWVADKMLSTTQITLPIDLLQQLMDYATQHGLDFAQLLTKAIQLYINPPSLLPDTQAPSRTQSYVVEITKAPKVAEDPPTL